MSIKTLSEQDRGAILQCIRVIADSQLIEDWEMRARLGVNRETLRNIIARWPNVDDSDVGSDDFLAISNCLNEICHGLRISKQDWDEGFTVTRSQVLESCLHWSGQR
jgi:hypothetical protein